jgi:alpha-beta hydrolase superfamily lysophospholipase
MICPDSIIFSVPQFKPYRSLPLRLHSIKMSKPVVIIVPGAWHRPKHYQRLNDGLEKFNYEAIGVTMPSVDSKPVVTSWDKDAEAVREQIIKCFDGDKDVIVIAHSYGGVPMSEAVKGLGKKAREEKGLKGGVVRLIYMCAIATQRRPKSCEPNSTSHR